MGLRTRATSSRRTNELLDKVKDISLRLESQDDLDPLIKRVGDARYVLLGEASHGTSEYYLWRARISKRLIHERGFNFIAVEGDWPDCYSLNRYVKSYSDSGENAHQVLNEFNRWPTWMWANWEIVALAEWLREYNEDLAEEDRIGFYGLDVYSLWESMREILNYMERYHPESVEAVRKAFECFEPYGRDPQEYAWATAFVPESCEDEVIDLLKDIRQRTPQHPEDAESEFDAEQNAVVTVNAERYYRSLVRGGSESWNLRDNHMADTLDRLMEYYGPDAKAIVWEHNTHIGDARATDMKREGMVNVGQITRERHGDGNVVLIGFGSYEGTVIASEAWGANMQRMSVPAAPETSWEYVMHAADESDKMLLLDDVKDDDLFLETRGHRAIGVVYNPNLERFGNYVPTILPRRYNAFLFLDKTQALHPLHYEPVSTTPPQTYPWGV